MTRIYFGRLEATGGSVAVQTPDGVRHLAAPTGPAPIPLAHAVLADLLGATVTDGLAVTFAGDVVSRLPRGDFVLGEGAIRDWLEGRGAERMTPDELVEHLGSIAGADADEEAGPVARLLDRCWSPQALAN